jgi:hypothetical protein
MRVADRGYFFIVGVACAVGWQYRIWPLPLLAFAVLEGASAYGVRLQRRLPAPVRLQGIRDPGDGVTEPFDQAA